jgi:hypothetical protein
LFPLIYDTEHGGTRMWKNLTITSQESDSSRYRVWNYPVKEMYSKLLSVIENAHPVKSVEEGFLRVNSKTLKKVSFEI